MGLAVFGMTVYQTYLIATGMTTVENYINSYKKETARLTGEEYVNVYDLGTRRNFIEFFGLKERCFGLIT